MPGSTARALEEVNSLRAALWPLLPLRSTLVGQIGAGSLVCYVSSSRAVWEALRRGKRVVFGIEEWGSLVSAFGEERAQPASFAEWCGHKRRNPTWKLLQRVALGGVSLSGQSCDASVGAVLSGWGVQLTDVMLGNEVPA